VEVVDVLVIKSLREMRTTGGAEQMINVIELKPGDKIQLGGDVIAEVIANPRDGIWIEARYVKVPDDPSQEGVEEMVFAEDIVDMA
jgi:hypothetical protein